MVVPKSRGLAAGELGAKWCTRFAYPYLRRACACRGCMLRPCLLPGWQFLPLRTSARRGSGHRSIEDRQQFPATSHNGCLGKGSPLMTSRIGRGASARRPAPVHRFENLPDQTESLGWQLEARLSRLGQTYPRSPIRHKAPRAGVLAWA